MCNRFSKQKLDPDLQKNGNFRSNLEIFEEKKKMLIRCGMGFWRYTCPNLTRTMHQMV